MSENAGEARFDVRDSHVAVLALDYEGRICDLSPEACALLGSSRDEILLHPLGAFLRMPSIEEILGALRPLPDGAELLFRTELERKDGSRRLLRLKISTDPAGRQLQVRLGHDRRAEDQLLEESDFLRALLDTCEGPVLVLNGDDRLVLCSRACATLVGASPSELRGQTPWAFFESPDESESARRALAKLRESRMPVLRDTWQWRTKSGERRTVAWKLSPLRIRGSAKVYVLAAGTELSDPGPRADESRRQQEDVRSALERIRSAVDSVPALISYLDRDRKYVFANRRYEDWFGIPASGVAGRRIDDDLPEGVWNVIAPQFEKAFLGQRVSFEIVIPAGEEGPRWLEVTVIPDLDGDGQVRGVFGQFHDITKLRRLISALSEQQVHLQAIMDHAPQAISLLDLEDRFLMVDREFEELLGVDRASLLGKRLRDVFPPAVAERMLQENECVRKSRVTREFEESLITPRGLRTLLSVKFPLFHADGSLYAVGTMSSDITERKRAEVEMRWLNDRLDDRVRDRTQELEKALSALQMFVYGMAHNLRAPLRTMAGFGQALLEDYSGMKLDASGQDLLRRIEMSAQRMDSLIQGLLDFGRVASGTLECRAVSLRHVVFRALALLKTDIAEGAARIDVPSELPEVQGDAGLLELILVHLISNAIKFVEPETRAHVVLSAELRGETVRLVLEDNGIGIAPEYHERIFEVFEQLGLPEAYPGTGIGLTIVRKAVDRLKGRVDFESEPGKGSRFWVELPKA